MKETRIKQVFEILSSGKNYFTGDYLSKKLGISLKSLRNDIKQLNSIVKDHGAIIQSRPRYGYLFVVTNQLKFDQFLTTQWYHFAFEDDFNSSEFRNAYLLKLLLLESNYVKSEDLAEALSISRSTLRHDLNDIKKYVGEYNLQIQSKANYGIKITGNELDRRRCIAASITEDKIDYVAFQDSKINRTEVISQLKSIILNVLQAHEFEITQVAFQNLITHLFVSLIRSNHSKIQFLNNKVLLIQETKEFAIAQEIAALVEQKFSVSFDKNESVYIGIHLLAKMKSSTVQNQTLTNDVDRLVIKALQKVKSRLHVNLTDDLNLRVNLGLHIASLLERLKYDLQMKNPLLDGIKQDIFAYEAATVVREIFKEELGVLISEDELGFISLHFSIAIQTINSKENYRKILIICGSGATLAQLMKLKLQEEFSGYIESIDTRDALNLKEEELKNYDLIITSIPLSVDCDVPVVEVNAFINQQDIDAIKPLMKRQPNQIISQYFDSRFYLPNFKTESKDDFFRKISDYIASLNLATRDILHELYIREDMATTELENNIAIPHPFNSSVKETFIVVAILDKPIIWEYKNVQLIVMLMIGDEEIYPPQALYQLISLLILNPDKVRRVIRTRNFSEFIQVLEEEN